MVQAQQPDEVALVVEIRVTTKTQTFSIEAEQTTVVTGHPRHSTTNNSRALKDATSLTDSHAARPKQTYAAIDSEHKHTLRLLSVPGDR